MKSKSTRDRIVLLPNTPFACARTERTPDSHRSAIPACTAHLEHERVMLKSLLERGKIIRVFARISERPGELHQDCPATSGFEKWRIPILEHAFVLRTGIPIVRESLPELARELAPLIPFDLFHPPSLANPSGWNKVQGSLDRPKCRRALYMAVTRDLCGECALLSG